MVWKFNEGTVQVKFLLLMGYCRAGILRALAVAIDAIVCVEMRWNEVNRMMESRDFARMVISWILKQEMRRKRKKMNRGNGQLPNLLDWHVFEAVDSSRYYSSTPSLSAGRI